MKQLLTLAATAVLSHKATKAATKPVVAEAPDVSREDARRALFAPSTSYWKADADWRDQDVDNSPNITASEAITVYSRFKFNEVFPLEDGTAAHRTSYIARVLNAYDRSGLGYIRVECNSAANSTPHVSVVQGLANGDIKAFINGVPMLPGKVVYINRDEEVVVSVTIRCPGVRLFQLDPYIRKTGPEDTPAHTLLELMAHGRELTYQEHSIMLEEIQA